MMDSHQFGVIAKFEPGGGSTVRAPCIVWGWIAQ